MSERDPIELPVFADVAQAADRLKGVAVRTPLLRSAVLDALVGGEVHLKAEPLQVTGSFKIRGAFNKIAGLAPEVRARGVVAFSSGNHAQGVAEAARRFGVPATIVMPVDAPAIKIERTRRLGAKLVLHDRFAEDRVAIAGRIAAQTGATLVPSFDDTDIVAGQGTAGLETIEEAGAPLDLFICPIGGGGLISGSALAFERLSPTTRVWGAEPEAFDDFRRSLALGEIVANGGGKSSICDALLSPAPGRIPFAIAARTLSGVATVSDEDVRRACRFAFEELKLAVEPGGAVALAAVLSGKLDLRGLRAAILLSGGNFAPEVLLGG